MDNFRPIILQESVGDPPVIKVDVGEWEHEEAAATAAQAIAAANARSSITITGFIPSSSNTVIRTHSVHPPQPPCLIQPGDKPAKIPRPPNAFMLFANTWRRRLARSYPGESNKQISVRLGKLWKSLSPNEKEVYFASAKEVDAKHKEKYPHYVYNPKEARLRKALRDQGRIKKTLPKWKSLPASSVVHAVSPVMLNHQEQPGGGLVRCGLDPSETMLQSYSDGFHSELSYHQIGMPPTPTSHDYSTIHNPWYNGYNQGGMQNGEYYGRSSVDSKTPSEWSSYHSDQDSPYIPQQIGSHNDVFSGSGTPDSGHYGMTGPQSQGPPSMTQELSQDLEGLIVRHTEGLGAPTQDQLLSDLHNGTTQSMLPNGLDCIPNSQPNKNLKEEDGSGMRRVDGGKESMKLPGFHQTFGTITEIGRFSQHDDYFEAPLPSDLELSKPAEPPPMTHQPATPPAKQRKTRGRKRKQPPVDYYSGRPGYLDGMGGGPADNGMAAPPQWAASGHHHQGCCGGDHYPHHAAAQQAPPAQPPPHAPWRHHPYYNGGHHYPHHQQNTPPPYYGQGYGNGGSECMHAGYHPHPHSGYGGSGYPHHQPAPAWHHSREHHHYSMGPPLHHNPGYPGYV